MEATGWIVFWWLAFSGSHIALSSMGVRPRLIERLGQGPFLGLYSLVAFGTFIPLCSVYFGHVHGGPLLWALGAVPGVHTVSLLLSGLGFTLLIGGLLQPSPAGMVPGAPARAYGLLRITRHTMFMPVAMWGLAHTLVNGYATDIAFFGGLFLYSVAGCAHQDARKAVTDADTLGPFFAETSLVPFAAIVSGRTRLVATELPWVGLAVGVVAATVFYQLHPWMFR